MSDSLPARDKPAPSRLDRLAARAGLAIGWERVWPGVSAILALAGVFLTVSFLGLWLETSRWARITGLLVFAAGLITILLPIVRLALPTRAERLARLDRDSGLPHRPATTLDDSLANNAEDPTTQALWNLHRRRAEQAAGALNVTMPSPRLVDHDRYALRGLTALAVVAAGFIAGPEKYARVLAAFDWRTPGALSQGYRLDAWIDPPAYTGKPPIILNLREEAAGQEKNHAARRVQAPVGSTIVVRASESANLTLETEGGLQAPAKDEAPVTDANPKPTAPVRQATSTDTESGFVLRGDARLILKRFGSVIAAFDIGSTPDKTPVIALKDQPKPNVRGSLTLGYKIDDDYGVIGAEANFSKPVVAGRAVTGRSLVEAPKMQLALPAGPGGLGEAETTADLSEHPWAGARVTMKLSARDEGGNEGHSDSVEITLPQRPFVKPLARALVEQRRNLILAPDDHKRVQLAIDALQVAPDVFNVPPPIYLGLNSIALRLSNAKTDAQLVEVADLLWEMALRIEDGGLSDAERDLRAAQQQLRDAIQRGASEEELRKLMEQLRAAMDKFLNELSQQAQRDERNQDQRDQNRNDNSRTITSQDLKSMLDRMEEMMKNGSMADAQRMLDQLQNMLENLQTARRPNQRGDQMTREMNRALDELDQMTRDEQQLRDDTFRDGQQQRNRSQRNQQRQQQQQSQRQRGQNQQGQQQQPGDDQADEGDEADDQQNAEKGQGDRESMQQRQQALRQRLEDLKNRMKQFGMKGDEGLDDAEGAMKEAEGELGKGEPGRGKAVDAEGRAIEGLRKGAQSMAQQMQQQGNQPGEGEGEQAGPGNPRNGQPREGRNANSDPLGREQHDKRDNNRQLYDPLGVPAAQRAQRVLEELRKRLGEQFRPREELDYLERLLKRY